MEEFKTVKFFREVKEQIAKDTYKMNFQQLKEYLKKNKLKINKRIETVISTEPLFRRLREIAF